MTSDVAIEIAVVSIGRDGKIVEFNNAAAQLFGYAASEVVGRDLAGYLIPPGSRGTHRRGFDRFLQSGRGGLLTGKPVRLALMRADGSEFEADLSMTAVEEGGATLFRAQIRP